MTLQSGAAVRSINPPEGAVLFGYPHVQRISTGVHDPLLASAVYLQDDARGVILMALDLLFLDPPTARAIRRAVAAETSIAEASVFISCTHTHSGPVSSRLLGWQEDPAVGEPDPVYLGFVREQVVDAAKEAVRRTQPAELAWTTADARGVGGNRLASGGVTDSEVGILTVRQRGGGDLLAVALVYGMHPTVLHEDSPLVSADFPHYARLHLKERFGESLTVVYHTAPCGNQSPRRFVNGQTFEEAERLGRKLGTAAVAAIEGLADDEFAQHCALLGALREVDLPRRTLPSLSEAERRLSEGRAQYERLKTEGAERASVRTAECAVFGAEAAVVLARANDRGEIDRTLDAYRPIEVQLLQVGDACLVGLPGELFTEYALEIKRRSPGETFVVSLVGGELQGYIVTPEGDAQGGYEAANSLFSPAAGSVMVDAVLAMIGEDRQDSA